MAYARKADEKSSIKSRPAMSPEAKEAQLVSLAIDLVEERLRNGTASSQETVHFLKLGTTQHREELEKLRAENELLKAKTESLQSNKRMEEVYAEALKAMKRYSGSEDEDDTNLF